jgi:hypothetical protein
MGIKRAKHAVDCSIDSFIRIHIVRIVFFNETEDCSEVFHRRIGIFLTFRRSSHLAAEDAAEDRRNHQYENQAKDCTRRSNFH